LFAVSAFAVALLVLAAIVVLLVVGGFIVSGRRNRANRARLLREIEQANQALAEAHAADNGWERQGLEAAARAAFAEGAVEELHLVQIIDRPARTPTRRLPGQGAGGRESRLVWPARATPGSPSRAPRPAAGGAPAAGSAAGSAQATSLPVFMMPAGSRPALVRAQDAEPDRPTSSPSHGAWSRPIPCDG
jgi:hypothetical protein